MSMRLTRWAYESLVAENIAWLKTMPRTLERDHILMILAEAVAYEYDRDAQAERTARAEGVAAERARVVAYLRSVDRLVWSSAPLLASRIERGEHDEEGT